ncbi:type 1 fimbria pilin [Serratia fonticola]|jgi:type 1 fimbria pilin|uniref:Type 1 fimbria pilin n=1 Tax=Serratia fonticola TaxID=47917 RepID=A0A542BKJ2_SERFO|nr:fimbrial protein [Serratia fonticola]TQI79104.1 type 1 fimbria pilin [Serratia fonticola]TQI98873.1 type 1 fimbria pilin [Serratia fonticola]TVZ68398.1 type 1 fimbria pilin [Serratia fonticola]
MWQLIKRRFPRPLMALSLLGGGVFGVCNGALADATVTFRGTLVEQPPCEVTGNNGAIIDVDFGDVMTTRIDGENYKKNIDFTLDCAQAVNNALKLRITGPAASFDTSALAGGKTGLGIALLQGTQRLRPGTWLNFSPASVPVLAAVPISDSNVTLDGGAFRVVASLVVDYQ